MIIVWFQYFNKSLQLWKDDGVKEFDDVEKAIKFCWSMKNNNNMRLIGYQCYDAYDREKMDKRVNVGKINGWW